jgi:hypothetical protein
MEGLDEETNGEPAPAADEVFCLLPEEYCYATPYDACNDAGKDIEAPKGFRRRVDGVDHAEADDEGSTNESKGIEATDKVGRPVWKWRVRTNELLSCVGWAGLSKSFLTIYFYVPRRQTEDQ